MSNEYRYTEVEIALIFEQAAEAQEHAQSQRAHGEGLTLPELQEIGSDAGISPEFVARAAASLVDAPSTQATKSTLGFPLTVERTVNLPGPFSGEEWDRLVVDLRETFRASGTVERHGELREWRNGNLHALVEPTDTGHRLRMRTTKGNAVGSLVGGSVATAMGLVFLLVLFAKGRFAVDDAMFLWAFVVFGLGLLGYTKYSLHRWAETRRQQMEAIASRTVARMTVQPEMPIHESSELPQIDIDELVDSEETGSERHRDRTRA